MITISARQGENPDPGQNLAVTVTRYGGVTLKRGVVLARGEIRDARSEAAPSSPQIRLFGRHCRDAGAFGDQPRRCRKNRP